MRHKLSVALLVTAWIMTFAAPALAQPLPHLIAPSRSADDRLSTVTIAFRMIGPVPPNAQFEALFGDGLYPICNPSGDRLIDPCEPNRTYIVFHRALPVGTRFEHWIYRVTPGAKIDIDAWVWHTDLVLGEVDQTYTYTYDFRSPATLPNTAMEP
jgi:hypothetical protein